MSKSKKSKPTSIVYRNAVKTLTEAKKRSVAGHTRAGRLMSEAGRLHRAWQNKKELWEDARDDAIELEVVFEYQQGLVDGFERAHQEYQKQLNIPTASQPARKRKKI